MGSILTRSILTLVLVVGSTAALADDTKAPAQPKPDALKGPAVPQRHVPGVDSGLGTMQGGDKRSMSREMPIPHREFMRMLEQTLGATAPEAIRATESQRQQIEKINSDFSAKQRSFMNANKGEIDQLVEKHGPEVRQLAARLAGARGEGSPAGPQRPAKGQKPPEMQDEMNPATRDMPAGLSDEARAEVISKLRELQASAPKPEDARTTIWGVLRPEQQAAVQARVDAFNAEREKINDEKYKEREKKKIEERGTKRAPASPGTAPPKSSPADKGRGGAEGRTGDTEPLDKEKRAELLKQLPTDLQRQLNRAPQDMQDRVLKRFGSLKPEQHEEFFQTLRERMKWQNDAPRAPKKG